MGPVVRLAHPAPGEAECVAGLPEARPRAESSVVCRCADVSRLSRGRSGQLDGSTAAEPPFAVRWPESRECLAAAGGSHGTTDVTFWAGSLGEDSAVLPGLFP